MIRIDSIIMAIITVLKAKEGRNTVGSSVQGGIVTTIAAGVGLAIAGPMGLAFGASLGSIGIYFMKKDSFMPIHQVVKEKLSSSEQEILANHVQTVIDHFSVTDAKMLLALSTGNPEFINALCKEALECLIMQASNNAKLATIMPLLMATLPHVHNYIDRSMPVDNQ